MASDGQVAGSIILGIVMVALWLFRAFALNKATVTRPDGSTVEPTTPQESEAASFQTPRKRQLGPTTITFNFINQRHAAVNDLKQKYGNAVRIVHRGKKWGSRGALVGSGNIYTLIIDVPVKCAACKEPFSVDDFGYIDCPSCGTELAVLFDAATRRKIIRLVHEATAAAPTRKKRERAPTSNEKATPTPTDAESVESQSEQERISERFRKIE